MHAFFAFDVGRSLLRGCEERANLLGVVPDGGVCVCVCVCVWVEGGGEVVVDVAGGCFEAEPVVRAEEGEGEVHPEGGSGESVEERAGGGRCVCVCVYVYVAVIG